MKAWPALVDERDSVAIKLFDNPQEQQQAMWRGLRRLLLLNIPSPIKYLHEKLPNKAKLGLYFNPYGKVLDLIDDCISCGVDKLIDEAGGPVWTEEGFSQLHDKVRAELNDTVVEIAKQVEQILTAVFNINKRLKGRVDMTMALGLSDIKAQMAGLVYRGFVTGNGFRRLGDTLRYLQAIEKRLEKMAIDPHRDRAQMLKVESVQQAWQQWLNKLPPNRREDDDVREDPLDDRGAAGQLLRPAAGHPVSYLGQASVAGDGANYPIAWLVVPGGPCAYRGYWSGVHV